MVHGRNPTLDSGIVDITGMMLCCFHQHSLHRPNYSQLVTIFPIDISRLSLLRLSCLFCRLPTWLSLVANLESAEAQHETQTSSKLGPGSGSSEAGALEWVKTEPANVLQTSLTCHKRVSRVGLSLFACLCRWFYMGLHGFTYAHKLKRTLIMVLLEVGRSKTLKYA